MGFSCVLLISYILQFFCCMKVLMGASSASKQWLEQIKLEDRRVPFFGSLVSIFLPASSRKNLSLRQKKKKKKVAEVFRVSSVNVHIVVWNPLLSLRLFTLNQWHESAPPAPFFHVDSCNTRILLLKFPQSMLHRTCFLVLLLQWLWRWRALAFTPPPPPLLSPRQKQQQNSELHSQWAEHHTEVEILFSPAIFSPR